MRFESTAAQCGPLLVHISPVCVRFFFFSTLKVNVRVICSISVHSYMYRGFTYAQVLRASTYASISVPNVCMSVHIL